MSYRSLDLLFWSEFGLITDHRDITLYLHWAKTNEITKLIGILQSSEIDFDDFQYCYLVADESGSILIGDGKINFSHKPNWKDKYPVVTEEYKKNQKIAFLQEYFRGKIWKGCYALDLSYLIGESGSVFMNWDSNPWEGEKWVKL